MAEKNDPMYRKRVDDNKSSEKILHQLTGLYQKDPHEFERMRPLLIKQTIAAFPARHRQRAYGLSSQLKCD